MRELVCLQPAAHGQIWRHSRQSPHQPTQPGGLATAQCRRGKHQRRWGDALIQHGPYRHQSTHAVTQQQRLGRLRVRIVRVDGRQVFQQIIGMHQRAARPRAQSMSPLIVTAHAVTAHVEPLRQPLVAPAVFAQTMHDQYGATCFGSRPVAQLQSLTIRHGQRRVIAIGRTGLLHVTLSRQSCSKNHSAPSWPTMARWGRLWTTTRRETPRR
jgi:hypothetical protein